ncbi:MAG: hypothetical protein AAGI68_12185 [Planctomycetota bacterium]
MAGPLSKDGAPMTDSGSPVQVPSGSDADNCECCGPGDPCASCDPTVSGSSPEDADVTGITQVSTSGLCSDEDCTTNNTAYSYGSFSETADFCGWSWSGTNNQAVTLIYSKKDNLVFGPIGFDTIDADEWGIVLTANDETFRDATVYWEAKTTGFACDSGKVSGTHTFGNPGGNEFGCCGGTPTVTIDP